MQLSIVERATLANQFKILAAVEEDEHEAADYRRKADILEKGYEGSYYQVFSDIDTDTLSEEDQDEVFRILNMFRMIRFSLDALGAAQTQGLNLNTLSFRGFDANHDKQYHFLAWWHENYPDRYTELGNLDLRAVHTLPYYRDMLERYTAVTGGDTGKLLTLADLQQLQ